MSRTPDAGVLTEWLETARAEVDMALGSTAEADWFLTTAEMLVLRHLPRPPVVFARSPSGLFVSPNTVKTHARGIYRKLGVSPDAARWSAPRVAGLVDSIGAERGTDAQW